MTGLLELKQRIKNLYGQYEIYIVPVLKFALALIYFIWINSSLGFMEKLGNPFVVLILALLCAILPLNTIVLLGFALIIGHCYAIGIEVAAFALILILFMAILFLRFSGKTNLILAFTPLACSIKMPAILPIGSGLLSSSLAAIPAGCGVIFYYFVRLVKEQASVLQNADTEIPKRIQIIADGMMKNQEMWLTVIAFVAVTLLVNIIRTRAVDYAWRISIVVGGVAYLFIMLGGSLVLSADISLFSLIISTVVAVLVSIILEFFVFGGDYTRTERLEYEDDEYYYYVKAVPKVSISTSERSIKKINAVPVKENKQEEPPVYANPLFEGEEKPVRKAVPERRETPEVEKVSVDTIDFEKKLEESLKDL